MLYKIAQSASALSLGSADQGIKRCYAHLARSFNGTSLHCYENRYERIINFHVPRRRVEIDLSDSVQ